MTLWSFKLKHLKTSAPCIREGKTGWANEPCISALAVLFLIILSGGLTGCSSSGTGLNLYSYEQEAQQGQELAAQIDKQMKIMHDPVLDKYIKNLGRMMISKGVPDPHFDFTFEVVDSDQVNAFAMPGGHAYVNLALLKEATSEAEVVGVVGHEIGHVLHRHGTKKMTDALLLQVAAIGAQTAVDGGTKPDGTGKYASLAVTLFGQAGLLKYGRNAELEADQSGIDILNRTGYDMQALPSFFKKLLQLEREHGGARAGFLADLLATHPPTQERIDKCEQLIATYPKQQDPKENSPEFEALRKYIAPLKPSKEATP